MKSSTIVPENDLKNWFLASAALAGLTLLFSLSATAEIRSAATVTVNTETGTAAARYSAGIAEILKLVDAKIDAEVIKAYIKSSPIAYNPGATEIISLKDRGVSSDNLSALLQQGDELHRQNA